MAPRSLPHHEWMDDPRLSLRGKGLLALLCARGTQLMGPVIVPTLAEGSRDGQAGIRAGLAELSRLGYLERSGRYYRLAEVFPSLPPRTAS